MFPIIEDRPGGDTSYVNNVPIPLLTQAELPTFTFQLEKSEGKSENGSYGKEANAANFPISTGLAGVSMVLAPGIMRELHWHADAAEWAFVISGRVRTTLVDPAGHTETADFEPGDVWYFPRGHGHQLEALGNAPCHFILIFDNGYFSEFGTFSISDWMSSAPIDTVARSLRVSADVLRNLPQGEVYFAKGAIPPEPAAPPLRGPNPPSLTHKYSLMSQQPTSVFPGGREWLVDSTRFPISRTMTGLVFELDAGALRTLHWHPNASEWQYVLGGRYRVTLFGAKGRYREEILEPGDAGYIPQGYGHSIENIGDETGQILLGLNAGTFQKIDLAEWIAGQPADVLETNFGLPADLVAQLPRRDVFITDERIGSTRAS
jgi:oxalate decarboxylase